ncbi:MAG: hypothetical protein DME09_02190 [Candidatus Rokuibacteriota bacterium]|nr:MAG: hypothetical protein DME09_02190 [Candidatus Rokubacteria bacterium]
MVMVSAAGLLFNGVQTKHFHLSDRIRGLMAELRDPATAADRLNQITAQLALFDRRLRLNQRSLEMLYAAIVCFVVPSLLLASTLWVGPLVLPIVITLIFALGVALLIIALGLEFVEMWISLETIELEMGDVAAARRARHRK